jgi:hypothetical protein
VGRVYYNGFWRYRMGGMARIDLTQDRDQWRAFVSMLMGFQVLQNAGEF